MEDLPRRLVPLSHLLSKLLRHAAPHVGLKVDGEGWCSCAELLQLNDLRKWTEDNIRDVVRTSYSSGSARFELEKAIDGTLRIRATHKHTIKGVGTTGVGTNGYDAACSADKFGASARPTDKAGSRVPAASSAPKAKAQSPTFGAADVRPRPKPGESQFATEKNWCTPIRVTEPPMSSAPTQPVLAESLSELLGSMCSDGPVSVSQVEESYEQWTGEALKDVVTPLGHSILSALRAISGCELFQHKDSSGHWLLRKKATGIQCDSPSGGLSTIETRLNVREAPNLREAPSKALRVEQAPPSRQLNVTSTSHARHKIVRAKWNGNELGEGYMCLKEGDKLWDTGELEDGWAFGELRDATGRVTQAGWYPPGFASFLKQVVRDWSSADPEYLSIQAGDELWDAGNFQDGWAWGEVRDEHGSIVQRGWYPPAFAEFKEPIPEDSAMADADDQEKFKSLLPVAEGGLCEEPCDLCDQEPPSTEVQKPASASLSRNQKKKARQRERKAAEAMALENGAAAMRAETQKAAVSLELLENMRQQRELMEENARLRRELEAARGSQPSVGSSAVTAGSLDAEVKPKNDRKGKETQRTTEEKERAWKINSEKWPPYEAAKDEFDTKERQNAKLIKEQKQATDKLGETPKQRVEVQTKAANEAQGKDAGASCGPVGPDARRESCHAAAIRRIANPVAAERGGGAGISEKTAARMLEQRRADEERGRLSELIARQGRSADAGPAGMFARARSASSKSLSGYIQHLSDQHSQPARHSAFALSALAEAQMLECIAGDLDDAVDAALEASLVQSTVSSCRASEDGRICRDGAAAGLQVGDTVEVTQILGRDTKNLLGRQGKVTGTFPSKTLGDSCTVEFLEERAGGSADHTAYAKQRMTFPAKHLRIIGCE